MKKMLKRVSGALLILESSIILFSKEAFADMAAPIEIIPSRVTSLVIAAIIIAVIIGVVFAVIVIINKISRNKKNNSNITNNNDKVNHNG